MENITIGQILLGIIFLLSIISNIRNLVKFIVNPIDKRILRYYKPVDKKIDSFEINMIKTYLINFINDVENGIQKSEIQKLNAYELYDRYNTLGGNSYIHDHFNQLKKEGKI